jgi:paraquat-inducible protein A
MTSPEPPPSVLQRQSVPLLLGGGCLLFGFGIFFPFFHVTKFWLFEDAVSVVGGLLALLEGGEYFLFTVLTLFTVVFPAVKLGLLAFIWTERDHDLKKMQRLHRLVAHLGKWSMLDVFVVAILIVVTKSAGVASIHVGVGLYLFTFSVLATQIASTRIDRLLSRPR